MPKLIHRSTGLKIVQNEKNGFTVVTLHYSADPAKRSSEWKREAAQGLKVARFEQEYEISYDSFLGEKIFPEIKTKASEIVVKEGPFIQNQWPRNLPMWGGFDFGLRNPSSFHVYTVYDGVFYAIWELYKPCKNIIEFAKEMKDCPYWDQVKFIAADPDIFNLKQIDAKTGGSTTVAQHFMNQGISKLVRGNNSEDTWIAAMQKFWMAEQVGFKILTSCPKLIEEFEAATYVNMTDRQLETSNYREAMVDKFNHALDDCKYFINSSPSVNPRKVKLPQVIGGFSGWQHESTPRNTTQNRFGYW